MPDDSRQRIGRYEIVGPLDAGGMGQVYRAWTRACAATSR